MNILVLALFERNSQNPKIMQNLCDEWERDGHSVFRFYPYTSKKSLDRIRNEEQVFAVKFPSSDDYNRFLSLLNSSKGSLLKLLKLFIHYPLYCFRYIAKRTTLLSPLFDESNIVKREIERILRAYTFDVIIAGSNPIYLPLGLAKTSCNCKKIWYQMDPHSANGMIAKNIEKEMEKEVLIYSAMDKVLVQPNAMKDIVESDFACFANKIHPAYFPLIYYKDEIQPEFKYFSRDTINCVFAGALMLPIRRPEYMLDLFSELKDKNINLYIWCGNLTKQLEQELNALLPENAFYCGSLPQIEMERVLCGADILVNLGNTVTNQFPSKILDYISLRKPIVNIYKTNNCPTLNVLKNYPLVINIDEEIDYKIEANRLDEFINANIGKLVDKKEINNNYAQYFPNNAANAVLMNLI